MTAVVAVLFVGCGKGAPSDSAKEGAINDFLGNTGTEDKTTEKDTDIASGNLGAYKDLAEYAEAQQKIQEAYNENDPEAAAKMMEAYAELGSKMELREFEAAESLDPPSDFPKDLIFDKGKITSASDDGDESYLNKSITIETTESLKTVRDFYKNLFSQPTWDLSSQSSDGSSSSFEATDSANISASVSISSDMYSKIISVSIYYSGELIP